MAKKYKNEFRQGMEDKIQRQRRDPEIVQHNARGLVRPSLLPKPHRPFLWPLYRVEYIRIGCRVHDAHFIWPFKRPVYIDPKFVARIITPSKKHREY